DAEQPQRRPPRPPRAQPQRIAAQPVARAVLERLPPEEVRRIGHPSRPPSAPETRTGAVRPPPRRAGVHGEGPWDPRTAPRGGAPHPRPPPVRPTHRW